MVIPEKMPKGRHRSGFRNTVFCPGYISLLNIVASLADSICRHPDVTLESGLVLNTIGELLLRFKLIIFTPFWNIPACADLSAFFGKACPGSSGGIGVACFICLGNKIKYH